MITLVLFAARALPKKHPEVYENAKPKLNPKALAITSLSAVSINIIFMAILALALKWTFLIFVGAAVVGIILYYVRKKQLGFNPTDFHPECAE